MEETEITTALVEGNVTEQIIAGLREHLSLTVTDEASLEVVKAARKQCRDLRKIAVDIAKKGREHAIIVQKLWIAKEKEVVGQIEEVEDALKAREEEYEKEEARKAFEAEQRQHLPERLQKLASIGITDVTEEELLKMSMTQFVEFFNGKHTAILEAKQKEQDDKDRAQKTETDRLERERLALLAQRSKSRISALVAMGMKPQMFDYVLENVRVTDNDIEQMDAEAWDMLIAGITPMVESLIAEAKRIADKKIEDDKKEAAEKARLAEVDRQKKEEEKKAEDARLEKERLAKEAAGRPDKDKLVALSNVFATLDFPEVETEEAKAVIYKVKLMVSDIIGQLS